MTRSVTHVASGQHQTFHPQAGVTLRLLNGGAGCQVFLVEVAAATRCPSPPHDGMELRYVISGTVTFTVGDREYVVAAGGTLHHPSSSPHGFRTEDGACTFITVALSRNYDITALFSGPLEGEP